MRQTARHRSNRANRANSAGFSLVEILVGVVTLAVALGMAGAMNGVATRGLRNSTALNDRSAAVEADIAQIRTMAERYTWCSGGPALEPSNVATCRSQDPADESYYSPAVSIDEAMASSSTGNTSMRRFQEACAFGTLTNGLITAIQARPQPDGVTRTVTPVTVDQLRTHRIDIIYSTSAKDPNPVSRRLMIVPTVAAWCP
jgi:Tfp pilus assembly protein PilV